MSEQKTCRRCGKNYIHKWETICHDCQMQEDIRHNGTEATYDEKTVFCPHCGQEIDCYMTDENLFEEAEFDMNCPHCEKRFHLEISVEYRYSTNRNLEDE